VDASLKDRRKYKDIAWLMPYVDVNDVLIRLGSQVDHQAGNQIRAFCPDHKLHTGNDSSHPNWTVNVKTGETFCYTEGRGSNLVFIVARMLDCGLRDAEAFLRNCLTDELETLGITALRARAAKIREAAEEKPAVRGLDAIVSDMENPYISDEAYRFFIHPPGKKYPTNITAETLAYHWVFERTWGYYTGRVVVPVVMRGLVAGFCALDIRGKDAWLQSHPLKEEDDYRKVLYPSNMVSGNCLYGFDDCEKGADFLVIVEGPREKMKLWQEGFTNAGAIFGSHLSHTQMTLIGELCPKKVVLMFDGDDAGVVATERAAGKLERFFPTQKCMVPRGKDPKNLSGEDFEKMLLL
jgi:5S rRNA maturation endonuclease (ribonuclease M5)